MSDFQSSDRERQDNEIEALQNICGQDEFFFNRKDLIECAFNVFLNMEKQNLQVIYNFKNAKSESKLYIEYLPPVRLYLKLPKNYPSSCRPEFHLSIIWLPPFTTSLICQKLDDMWDKSEILYAWLQFLKNELYFFLNIKDILDVTFLYTLFKEPTNKNLLDLIRLSDSRALNGALYLNPIERLIEYEKLGAEIAFKNNYHKCGICFDIYFGLMCVRFELCHHIFCRNCVLSYLTIKIDDRLVENIKCPSSKCRSVIKCSEIKSICPIKLFEKYENILSQKSLAEMKNIVYCPRCNLLAEKESDENLAQCFYCEYSFCAYCLKVYHGITPCYMNSEECNKLIEEYQNSDIRKKKYLEKKFGRKQIQLIVEKQLTKMYLTNFTRSCPKCNSKISKNEGCNLICCIACKNYFCWICAKDIGSEESYEHFNMTNSASSCSGKLYENKKLDS